MRQLLLSVLVAVAVPALAQHQTPPGVDPNQFKPLPDRKDVLSWKLLSQVELVKQKDRYVPQFAKDVAALDQKEVKVQGFMMPLQVGDKQSHFVLTAMPQSCAFCLPGGPESMVEVKTKTPVKYTFEPLVLTGKLAILKDDPTGVFYRLTDAVPSK
ncbi:MAG TPA: DUF3299 domain-containing protein [Burkholderiales bacterium]|nr:DUF3299 domain-containing protein [Burkholderiales bacterium]